jgi:hypothetical protein
MIVNYDLNSNDVLNRNFKNIKNNKNNVLYNNNNENIQYNNYIQNEINKINNDVENKLTIKIIGL